MDAVRDKLLFGREGVPFGLIMAQIRFADITYLASHDFRAGSRGFKRQRTRWSFALLIVSCTLLAILAGPSTALLLIPVYNTAWLAGAASFWLSGDFAPNTLDVSSLWDKRCTSTGQNLTLLQSTDASLVACPWGGYPYLDRALVQSAFSQQDPTITYEDSISRRGFDVILTPSIKSAIVGNNIIAGYYARFLSDLGCDAMFSGPQTAPGHRLENLYERQRNGTRGIMEIPLPLVRSQCLNASGWIDTAREDGRYTNGTLPVSTYLR